MKVRNGEIGIADGVEDSEAEALHFFEFFCEGARSELAPGTAGIVQGPVFLRERKTGGDDKPIRGDGCFAGPGAVPPICSTAPPLIRRSTRAVEICPHREPARTVPRLTAPRPCDYFYSAPSVSHRAHPVVGSDGRRNHITGPCSRHPRRLPHPSQTTTRRTPKTTRDTTAPGALPRASEASCR